MCMLNQQQHTNEGTEDDESENKIFSTLLNERITLKKKRN